MVARSDRVVGVRVISSMVHVIPHREDRFEPDKFIASYRHLLASRYVKSRDGIPTCLGTDDSLVAAGFLPTAERWKKV
jgi:hypothetical protein